MIVAVVGLQREARLVAGPGIVAIVAGARSGALRAAVDEALRAGARGVISIGLAGALDPSLPPGAVVIGAAVARGAARTPTSPAWRERLRLLLPEARCGVVAAADAPVADAQAKSRLRAASGGDAVDMESGAAADAAAAAGAPFAVVRTISDGAHRSLPAAAAAGFGADGSMDVTAVLRGLLRRPSDLPALIRTGVEAEAGFQALLRCRRRLGPTLGFADV